MRFRLRSLRIVRADTYHGPSCFCKAGAECIAMKRRDDKTEKYRKSRYD